VLSEEEAATAAVAERRASVDLARDAWDSAQALLPPEDTSPEGVALLRLGLTQRASAHARAEVADIRLNRAVALLLLAEARLKVVQFDALLG
jgi:hypothetical protein